MNEYLKNLKYDIPASIIVFLVAVPLCLGIALASFPEGQGQENLFSGVIAGIVGGIVVGLLSGSQLGVSGPAAGLAVIVLNAIVELKAFDAFLLAVVIGGAIQLLFGFLRAGVIGYFFPNSVIKGMLAGIGIIIFKKQIPIAFGQQGFADLKAGLSVINTGTVTITAISLVILILWEQKFMKRIKLFQLIQGPLVVVCVGVVLGLVFKDTSLALAGQKHLVSIPVSADLTGFLGQFTFPDFDQLSNPAVWKIGITIAIVASLETLLCLDATDKLDPYKRVAPANRELKAQGVGNMLSGLIGGLPVTQVIVRSSTNIQSGGRTKVSAILHGFILLICVVTIPQVLNMIPLASLAAILFMVGYKLAKPELFKAMYQQGKTNFVPFIVTIAGIVMIDLLVGIGLGLLVAICFILYHNYKKPFLFDASKHYKDGRIYLEFAEDVTFINKASIRRTLSEISDGSKVVLDASKTLSMDYDVREIIKEFIEGASHREIEVEVVELSFPRINNQYKEICKVLHAERKKKMDSLATAQQES